MSENKNEFDDIFQKNDNYGNYNQPKNITEQDISKIQDDIQREMRLIEEIENKNNFTSTLDNQDSNLENNNSLEEDSIKSVQNLGEAINDKSLLNGETPNNYATVTANQNNSSPYTTLYKESIKTEESKNKKQGSGKFKRAVALVCVGSVLGGSTLGFGIGFGTVFGNKQFGIADATGNEQTSESVLANASKDDSIFEYNENAIAKSSSQKNDFVKIIREVTPSVVCISSSVMMNNFFSQSQLVPSSGSGIIFLESDTKYYIATNAHVIEQTQDLSITIEDSEPIKAEVVNSDPQNDLAVIYVTKDAVKAAGVEKVVIAKFGDSDEMEMGEDVIAIGNALGEGITSTNGIVSATNKKIPVAENVTLTMMQTNAAINPGNSGGPLINMSGEVIGINTAKAIAENSEGMGYSIPSNVAKPILQEFIDSINRPYMGVRLEEVTAEFAKQYNLPSAGVIIMAVEENTPAQKSGIKRGDLITGFDGKPIFSVDDLYDAIGLCEVGQEVEVKLVRNGSDQVTVKLVLEKRL